VATSSTGGDGNGAPARRRGVAARRLLIVLLLLAVVAAVVLVVRDVRGSDVDPSTATTPTTAAPTSVSTPAAPSSTAPTTSPPTTSPPTTSAPPTFDRSQLSTTDPTSPWVVVDKALPLTPLDYAPADLVPVGGGYELRAEAAQAMTALLDGAAAEGLTVSVQSAYRSYDYQVDLFGRQVARFGEAQAEIQVARPGFSEHQTGLAADVGGGGCDIDGCFATTAEGQWVAAHAAEYGYLVRYPDGKTDVTGFRYEPWHIRYVGVALATEMQRTGVQTMEEFFGLPAAPGYTS